MADMLYLVRHAAPPVNSRNRFWGKADPGVDAADLSGVSALVALFPRKPDVVVSSPVRRAFATAEVLAGAMDMAVATDPQLAEVDFGLFDGLNFTEAAARYPAEAERWSEFGDQYVFPEGESTADFLVRADQAWRRWIDCREEEALIVSHAGVLSVWMCLFLGLPPERRFLFRPAYSSLTAFRRKRDGSGWDLAFFNNRI